MPKLGWTRRRARPTSAPGRPKYGPRETIIGLTDQSFTLHASRLKPQASSLKPPMIENIIEFSIRNRFVVIIATLALVVWGVYSVINTPIDAIPDLSENQVIVFTDWMGRSPREIEDQVTYPLSVNLQGLAGVKSVRSSSEFNFSMINIIFEDDDRFLLRPAAGLRAAGAGQHVSAAGRHALSGSGRHGARANLLVHRRRRRDYDLGRLRAIQDWYVRYQLNSVPGVAQVASVGGYPIEYQIDVDPLKLRAYGVTLGELYSAVARSNSSVGGRVIHKGNAEYLVRGVGWINSQARHRTDRRQDRSRDRHADHASAIWPRSASARNSAAACSKKTATKRSAAW